MDETYLDGDERRLITLYREQFPSLTTGERLVSSCIPTLLQTIAELRRKNIDLSTLHAEWALRATIYHEMLLTALDASGVAFDPAVIEREMAERMERIYTAANTLAALS